MFQSTSPDSPGGKRVQANGIVVQPESIEYDGGNVLKEFIRDKDAALANTAELQIGFDSVIFDDGVLVGPDRSQLADRFAEYVKAKQDVYRTIVERLERCSASEDFWSPVRALLLRPDSHWRLDLSSPSALYQSEAAAEAISWQRRSLLEMFRPALRDEPFVVRRRSEPGAQ